MKIGEGIKVTKKLKRIFASAMTLVVMTTTCVVSSATAVSAALISDNTYYIKNVNSNKYLEVAGASNSNGANVQQWTGNGNNCQKWVVKNIDNNYVYIRSAMSGNKSLDIQDGKTADGTNVRLWDFNGSDAQIFKIKKVSSGKYAILPKCAKSKSALDVYNWSTADGGDVKLWAYNGLDCQTWKFEKTSSSSSGSSSSGSSSSGSSSSGSSSSGSSSSGSSSSGASASGTKKTITSTITVKSGQTYDGKGVTIVAKGMGDGGQGEGQKPIFKLEKGASLKNVVIAAPGCDGIHVYGNNTIQNVTWEDVGEDAMTVKGSTSSDNGTVTVKDCKASYAYDKLFQVNAICTLKCINVTAYDIGKFIRQNGGKTFKTTWYLDSCTINKVKDSIARSDSKNCKVYYRNLKVSNCSTYWKLPSSSQASTY